MNLARARRWAIGVALLALGGALLRVALWRPLELVGDVPADGLVRVPGVVHVHTTLSDGGGTPQEVIGAARQAGLSFLGISDHNNLEAKALEGYRDGVLVLVGAELSTPAGHLLGLGLDRDPPFRFNGDGLDGLEDVRDLGGLAFAAHPFSSRADLRWVGWDLPGAWGIEVQNGDSEWRKAGPRLLLTAGLFRVNPRYALLQALNPPDEALRRWDGLLARRDTVGIAGADAHSRLPLTRRFALRFPSYASLFGLSQLHLLLDRPLQGEAAADRGAVLAALRRGRFYMGQDALAAADGFAFSVRAASGEQAAMGESLRLQDGLVATAAGRVPKGTRIVLLRDGRPLAEGVERLTAALPGPGVYRVEARVPGWPVPWVLTNPVYVFDEAAREARRRAAAWPSPPVPAEIRPLASLEGTAEFVPEHDPTSSADLERTDVDGRPALRLAFRLGAPTAQQPFTWCALVNRQVRDLSAWSGLRLRLRADGEYRPWVQVRDVNPASTDEGLEWWLASVRTSTAWREVFLPFSRFRTINRRTDGRLDLAQTRAIVFVLDAAAVKAGTRGTIWLSDVALYR